jgi:two-component system, response regulator PdtaR
MDSKRGTVLAAPTRTMTMPRHPTARWRVSIVDDHEPSRADVRAAVAAAGGEVVGEASRGADALGMVTSARPDVVVFAVGLPDGDGVAAAALVTTTTGCPVVLFTSHTRDELVARAQAAGVMAYLLKPLRAAELAPALDLAVARFAETRQLRQTLEERKVIERAKGRLMDKLNLTEEEAFRRLRRAAMNSRRPMVEIARALLVSESVTEDLPRI